MTRKRVTIAGCIAAIVIAAIVWTSGLGQSESGPASSGSQPVSSSVPSQQAEADRKLVADAATRLAADLTSENQTAYKAAWSQDNVPPLPPAGTKIIVKADSALSFGAYGRVDAAVDMPDKSTVKSIIHLELTTRQWLVHHIEEVK